MESKGPGGSKGKRKAVDEGETGTSVKRCHLIEDPSVTNNLNESDDEFIVESESDENVDSSEDSSDIDEDEEDADATMMVCGFQINTKFNEDGTCWLVRHVCGKEYKMIAPVQDIQEAKLYAQASLKEDLIPVFEASGIEVTRNHDSEMVLYCENLKQVKEKHKFANSADVKGLHIQQNCVSVIKLQSMNEEFATKDLVETVL